MLPETLYRITESWHSGTYYRIERDGELAYEVDGISGEATFESPEGEVKFTVKTWGLEDERYGYVVRDADGADIGWIADDVPLVGRKLNIKNMDDETIATLGDSGIVGTAIHEVFALFNSPIPSQSSLEFRTPEGHTFGKVQRNVGARTYTVALEDVGLDHRLALAALVVLNSNDRLGREIAYDRFISESHDD